MHVPYEKTINIARPSWLEGGRWTLSDLTTITTIFGKNGSGKSVLLRAWRDTDMVGCHYVVPERTGEFDYQSSFLDQQSGPQRRRENSARNFSNDYRRQIVARIPAYFAVRGNYRKGDKPSGDPAELEVGGDVVLVTT
jgi:hypothetical protein